MKEASGQPDSNLVISPASKQQMIACGVIN
jgi:hypothetical protein